MKKIILILIASIMSGCATQKNLNKEYQICIHSNEKKAYLYRLSEREKVCKKEIFGE